MDINALEKEINGILDLYSKDINPEDKDGIYLYDEIRSGMGYASPKLTEIKPIDHIMGFHYLAQINPVMDKWIDRTYGTHNNQVKLDDILDEIVHLEDTITHDVLGRVARIPVLIKQITAARRTLIDLDISPGFILPPLIITDINKTVKELVDMRDGIYSYISTILKLKVIRFIRYPFYDTMIKHIMLDPCSAYMGVIALLNVYDNPDKFLISYYQQNVRHRLVKSTVSPGEVFPAWIYGYIDELSSIPEDKHHTDYYLNKSLYLNKSMFNYLEGDLIRDELV